MGRLLVVLGFLALIGGFAGMMTSTLQPIQDLVSTVTGDSALNERASEFCEPGENLVKEEGASSYSPTQGWGRPVYYYCVNNEGSRREVTGEFATDLLSDTTGTIFSTISASVLWAALLCMGPVLIIIGFIVTMRRRVSTTGAGRGVVVTHATYNAADLNTAWGKLAAMPSATSDLATRLRNLEQARDAKLITQEEYDRLRQQILDGMA